MYENDVNSTDENPDGTWTKRMLHEWEYRYSWVTNSSVGHEESNTVNVTVIGKTSCGI